MVKTMYKITCFAPIEPIKLEQLLKGFHFKSIKNGMEWSMDGSVFRIEPFQNQSRNSMKAYRIYFSGDIYGGAYLFDLCMGCFNPEVTGIEYLLQHPSKSSDMWNKELRNNKSIKTIDLRGIYEQDGVGIVVINDTLTLQLRSKKGKKLIIVDALKQVEIVRDKLLPSDFDLFSFTDDVAI